MEFDTLGAVDPCYSSNVEPGSQGRVLFLWARCVASASAGAVCADVQTSAS